jgi:hypothetical protein
MLSLFVIAIIEDIAIPGISWTFCTIRSCWPANWRRLIGGLWFCPNLHEQPDPDKQQQQAKGTTPDYLPSSRELFLDYIHAAPPVQNFCNNEVDKKNCTENRHFASLIVI